MALPRGMAAISRFAQDLSSSVVGFVDALQEVGAAAEIAQQFREMGEEGEAEACLDAAFDHIVEHAGGSVETRPATCFERLDFERVIARLTDENAEHQQQSAAAREAALADKCDAAEKLSAEVQASRNAMRSLIEANAQLAAARAREHKLSDRIAELEREVGRKSARCPRSDERKRRRSPSWQLHAASRAGGASKGAADAQDGGEEEERNCDEGENAEDGAQEEEDIVCPAFAPGAEQRKRGARGGVRVRAARARSERCQNFYPATGADLPPDPPIYAVEGEPRFWPPTVDRFFAWRPPGYKVLIQDMPAIISRTQIAEWLVQKACPDPRDINDAMEPRQGRGQLCLTFDRPDEAITAKVVLDGSDLEPGACLTKTKWWSAKRA